MKDGHPPVSGGGGSVEPAGGGWPGRAVRAGPPVHDLAPEPVALQFGDGVSEAGRGLAGCLGVALPDLGQGAGDQAPDAAARVSALLGEFQAIVDLGAGLARVPLVRQGDGGSGVDLDDLDLVADGLVGVERAWLQVERVGWPVPGQGLDQVGEGLAFGGDVGGLAGQVQGLPVAGFRPGRTSR